MKIKYFIIGLLLTFSLTSCLTSGLEDLPTFEDADITNFKFEYRWSEKEGESERLKVKVLNTDIEINKEKQEVICRIKVPEVDSQGFTEEIRNKVSLSNIVGYCSISTAATIKPIGGSPKLGVPQDFTEKKFNYEVTAADKTTQKTWKVIIESFKK